MKDSKPIKLGMGPYPEVTLAHARTKAYEANSQRANGLDPKEVREHLAEQTRIARLHTFELLNKPMPLQHTNGASVNTAATGGKHAHSALAGCIRG